MKLTELPRARNRSLLGTCDLVMVHGEVPLDEKLIVVGIEHGRVDVLAGEGLNGFPGLPEAHRDELGTIALDPPQEPGSAVARRALVAFDSGPLHIRRICGSVLRPDRSTPDSRNHPQQLPAGIGSKRTPAAYRRRRQGIPVDSLSVESAASAVCSSLTGLSLPFREVKEPFREVRPIAPADR